MRIAIAIVLTVAAGAGIIVLLTICKGAARGDRMMGIGETRGGREDEDSSVREDSNERD